MKRSELGELVDLRDHIVVNEHGAVEVLAALHDTVADRVDLVEGVDRLVRTGRQRLEDERHRIVVVAHLRVDDRLVLVETVLVEGISGTHALADALGEQFVRFHVDELILQGR